MANEHESAEAQLDLEIVSQQLRDTLAARADRLDLEPMSITSPTPGAVIARGVDGTLLRLDFRAYRMTDLNR